MTIRMPQAIINQAVLMASTPQDVFSFLKQGAERGDEARHDDEVDKTLEAALLSRNDPLIDLGLARYGVYAETLKALFVRPVDSLEGKAIRYSVLSNDVKIGYSLDGLPGDLFDSSDAMLEYFKGVEVDELGVLFKNPRLSDNFLRHFFEGDSYWGVLSEEERLVTLEALYRNERIAAPYDDSWMDGYADYSYHAVFDSVWKLAETVPVNVMYASRLSAIYGKLIGRSFSLKDPLTVAKRWVIDPSDTQQLEREAERNQRGYLSPYQGVREGLAVLVANDSANDLLNSDDVALRCAVYKSCALTTDQIEAGYSKDGELFFNEAVWNPKLWMNGSTREGLKKVAWAVTNADKNADLIAVNIYNSREKAMAKEHPNWFIGEDYRATDDPEDLAVTKADLNQLGVSIVKATTGLIDESLQKISKHVNWVFLLSLFTLLFVLYKHY